MNIVILLNIQSLHNATVFLIWKYRNFWERIELEFNTSQVYVVEHRWE